MTLTQPKLKEALFAFDLEERKSTNKLLPYSLQRKMEDSADCSVIKV